MRCPQQAPSQLGALFGEVPETLGGTVYLEKAGHRGHAFVGLSCAQSLPHYLLPVHPEEKRLLTILVALP